MRVTVVFLNCLQCHMSIKKIRIREIFEIFVYRIRVETGINTNLKMHRCRAISKKNSSLRKNHKINRRIDYWNLTFVELLQDGDNLYECPQCHKKNSTNTCFPPYLKVMNFRISLTVCIYCGYRFQSQISPGRPKNRFDYRFYDGSENVA